MSRKWEFLYLHMNSKHEQWFVIVQSRLRGAVGLFHFTLSHSFSSKQLSLPDRERRCRALLCSRVVASVCAYEHRCVCARVRLSTRDSLCHEEVELYLLTVTPRRQLAWRAHTQKHKHTHIHTLADTLFTFGPM